MADQLADAVQAVAGFLVADVPLGETLHRIAVVARDALPPTVAVGITLLDEHERPTTAVSTDDLAPTIDGAQYAVGDGPCLSAYRERRVVRVDDMAEAVERWPASCRTALDNNVFSSLSLPLIAGGDAFGAVNLYAGAPGAYDDEAERAAALIVTQASVVLANAEAYWRQFELASSLEQALESRAVIEQAKGKLMAANACTADEAFTILVKASQRENVKLREVARRLVTAS
jgi:GAF domain-containing protein